MNAEEVARLSAADRELCARGGLRSLNDSAQLALALDTEFRVRLRLAKNPEAVLAAQLALARDPVPVVRLRLAENAAFCPTVLFPAAFLEEQCPDFVREAVATCSDPQTAAVLLEGWDGTLSELLDAAHELAPEVLAG